MKIGQSVFVGARGKVHLRDESFTWVRESGVSAKLQEVGVFPTWVIYSLKVIQWLGVFLEAVIGREFQSQNLGTECRNFWDCFS